MSVVEVTKGRSEYGMPTLKLHVSDGVVEFVVDGGAVSVEAGNALVITHNIHIAVSDEDSTTVRKGWRRHR